MASTPLHATTPEVALIRPLKSQEIPEVYTGDDTGGMHGFSRGLVIGSFGDSVRLTTFLGDVSVEEGENIRSDRVSHNMGERNGIGSVGVHVLFNGLDEDQRSDGEMNKMRKQNVLEF
ncbi:hypothetical protein V6N11_047460 [Hibiscus sabdariffa]|uniref:Uncharacterized protein n=2 Tax=Hibiscus sabdariffa TaxID=183260 RepID=A0ABR2A9N5_9ROSI